MISSFRSPYYYFKKILNSIYEVLPGDNIHSVAIHHCDPISVETTLDGISVSCDTLVLTKEIWAHEQIDLTEDIVANHPKFKHCTKIIYTAGYDNKVITDRTYKVASNYWYKIALQNNANQPWSIKNPSLTKNVLCINGRDAAHRIELGYRLYKEKLLDSIVFSQDKLSVPLTTDFDGVADLHQYLDLLPIQLDQGGRYNDHSVAHPVYNATYANVVTETEIELRPLSRNVDIQLTTEKSFKPFFAGQVPVLLAGAGHYNNLKHLGFDMFEELLPSGFDYMSGRDKISVIVDLISKGDEFFEDLYFSNIARLKYNFNLAQSNTPWERSLREVKALLN